MTNKWLSWVRANDKEIFDNLEIQGSNLVKSTSILVEIITNYGELLQEKKQKITELEHNGDEISHKLYTILSQTFVTPIDREDISKLTSAIDEVLDYVDGISERFILFKIKKPTPYMKELAKIILSSSQEIYTLVKLLNKQKDRNKLLDYCSTIKKYEHDGDKIYRNAIAELFETNEPIEIIKLKEVYDNLEEALDKCQDVADIVEDISLKYG